MALIQSKTVVAKRTIISLKWKSLTTRVNHFLIPVSRAVGLVKPVVASVSLVFALVLTGCENLGGVADREISHPTPVLSGAEVLADSDFESLSGLKVGLIANHTSRINSFHLADVMATSSKVQLVALFGPEHGIRGDVDAGAKIEDGTDPETGIPVFSLYGANRRPTPDMMSGLDVLVFDIQDVGARFYTFISTLGLSMQSAAEAGVPFVVLDRPNPLGGKEIEGFVLDTSLVSFVGQYPIPIRHGLTVGELARMIQGEAWLPGLDDLDLRIVPMENWTRSMLWPETGLDWIPTSPNLPTFETALMYPGTCFFEATTASEGRGTELPFLTVGAPWMDAQAVSTAKFPGLTLIPGHVTPIEMPGKSSNPKWKDTRIESVSIRISTASQVRPVSEGLELIARMYATAPQEERAAMFNTRWMSLLGGTTRLQALLEAGITAEGLRQEWSEELAQFDTLRQPYLLYD